MKRLMNSGYISNLSSATLTSVKQDEGLQYQFSPFSNHDHRPFLQPLDNALKMYFLVV